MRKHDPNAKKYTCTHEGCGKEFFSKSKLETHMPKHSEEKVLVLLIAMISPLCTRLEFRSMKESVQTTQTGLTGLPVGSVARIFLSEGLSKGIWTRNMMVLQSTSKCAWLVRRQIPSVNGRLGIVSGRASYHLDPVRYHQK